LEPRAPMRKSNSAWKKRKNGHVSYQELTIPAPMAGSRPGANLVLPNSPDSLTSGHTPGAMSPHDPSFASTPYGPPDDAWMVSHSHSASATPQSDDLMNQSRDSGYPLMGKTILSPNLQRSNPTPGEHFSDPSLSLDEDISKGLYDADSKGLYDAEFVEPPENLNIGVYDKLISEARANHARQLARMKSLDIDALPALPSSFNSDSNLNSDSNPLTHSSLRSSMDMDDQTFKAAMSHVQPRQVSAFGNIPDLPPTPSGTSDVQQEQPTFSMFASNETSSERVSNSDTDLTTENMISL